MSDILSAISLLLAIETALFGFIYTDVKKSLELEPNKYPEDDKLNFSFARNTLVSKLRPLLIISIIIPLLFVPEAIKIIKETIITTKLYFFEIEYYSTSYSVVLFINFCLFVLTFYLMKLFYGLRKVIKSINPDRKS